MGKCPVALNEILGNGFQIAVLVLDDNPCTESLFCTAKYRPEFPANGFASLNGAWAWAAQFVHWHNVDHRHSSIRYVSSQQRHAGEDKAILAARLHCAPMPSSATRCSAESCLIRATTNLAHADVKPHGALGHA